MNHFKINLKSNLGISLISLVITIIVILLLAGISIFMLTGDNGILNKGIESAETTKKETAAEKINLKITNTQIKTYSFHQRMPTLQELANDFCEDDDIEYVSTQKKLASLDKIILGEATSFFTKLKDYPYEFEIDHHLKLASIDGIKVSTIPSNDDDTIVSMTKAELESLIANEVTKQLSNNLPTGSTKVDLLYSTSKEEGIPQNSITLENEIDVYDYIQVVCVNPDQWRGFNSAFYFINDIIFDGTTNYEINAFNTRYLSFSFGTDKKSIVSLYNQPIGIYRVYGIKL